MLLKIKKIGFAIAILGFAISNAQQKLPFAIVSHKEGYANVRVHKDDYRKIVDKIKKGEVFLYEKVAEGETDWVWIKYPKKSKVEVPFERLDSLKNEGMINKERFMFIDQLPSLTPSITKNGRTIILTNNHDTKRTEYKRTKIYIDIYASNAKLRRNEKNSEGKITSIDKAKPWGISNEFPEDLTEVKSIRIQQEGRGFTFPREALKNLFQPTKDFEKLGAFIEDEDSIFLYMINGAGENRYTTIWTIKEGKAVSQIIYHDPE